MTVRSGRREVFDGAMASMIGRTIAPLARPKWRQYLFAGLAALSLVGFLDPKALAQDQAKPVDQAAEAARCKALLQQAQAGQWLDTAGEQDVRSLSDKPYCVELERYEASCEVKNSFDLIGTHGTAAERARAVAAVVEKLSDSPNCKGMIGASIVCTALKEQAKRPGGLASAMAGIAQECATVFRADAAVCLAWHKKALAGQWFTEREAADFESMDARQELLLAEPACKQFFELQGKCENAWNRMIVSDGRAAARKAQAGLVVAIETIPGCKSIIGFQDVCEAVKEQARGARLSAKLQSILRECAEGNAAANTARLIRPGL